MAATLPRQPVQKHRLYGCNIANTACPEAYNIWLQHCQDGLSKSMDYIAGTLQTQPFQRHRLYGCNIASKKAKHDRAVSPGGGEYTGCKHGWTQLTVGVEAMQQETDWQNSPTLYFKIYNRTGMPQNTKIDPWLIQSQYSVWLWCKKHNTQYDCDVQSTHPWSRNST